MSSTKLDVITVNWLRHATSPVHKKQAASSGGNVGVEDGCGLRLSINSIDVSPLCTHIATGGDDFAARIWSLAALRNGEDDEAVTKSDTNEAEGLNEEEKKLLKERMKTRLLSKIQHDREVSAVKWKPSTSVGILATATDSGRVYVWRKALLPDKTEMYANIWSFVSHSSNITDIIWSPDGTLLASCSVCSCVVIQDAQDGAIKATIQLKGPAKGLSWDPQGIYLAVLVEGSPPSTEIIKAGTWNIVHSITDNLFDPTSLFFRRPSFSPDGKTLAVVAARGKLAGLECPLAAELKTGNWQRNYEFTATSTVEVARYGPLFKDSDGKIYSPLALGCHNSDIAAVRAGEQKAIFMFKGFFKMDINDMVWTSDGMSLIACSRDGKVAVINVHGLGTLCTSDEIATHMTKVHGDALGYAPISSINDIPESAFQFQAEQAYTQPKQQPQVITPIPINPTTTTTTSINDSKTIMALQKVTTTKNGRKRIAPVVQTAVFPSDTPTTIDIQQQPQLTQAQQNLPLTTTATTTTTTTTTQMNVENEKKVISPLPILIEQKFPPKTTAPISTTIQKRIHPSGSQQFPQKKKKHHKKERSHSPNRSDNEKDEDVEHSTTTTAATVNQNPISKAIPQLGPAALIEANPLNKKPTEDENDDQNEKQETQITFRRTANKIGWNIVIKGAVTNLTGNGLFCAIACSDGTILILDSESGCIKMPRIHLGSSIILLESNNELLAVLTKKREFSLWDMNHKQCIASCNKTIGHSISLSDNLALTITSNGTPVITSSLMQFAFSKEIGTWISSSRHGSGTLPLSEIEQQLQMSKLIGSKEEYRLLLATYSHMIADGFYEGKIRFLIRSLAEDAETKELIPNVLQIISSNRALQRLVSELRNERSTFVPGEISKPTVGK